MNVRSVLAGLLLAAPLVAMTAPAEAKKMVYSPIVHAGEKELEYYVDWHEAKGSGTTVLGHELELAYVYSDKDTLALYGVWDQQSAGGGGTDATQFAKWKIEWIHQLFEQGERSWDAGIYVEYQISADTASADKIELKPLFQKSFDKLTLTLNGVLEKKLDGVSPTEGGYAAQLKWRLSPSLEPMLELYGGVGEIGDMRYKANTQLLGPVFNIGLGKWWVWQVGALYGISDASEDLRIKSNIAFEWY
ncbi:MAG: hypothetical protein OEY97_08885 [Nitrospirota bacterium]|nr:hypothetical protein [Nitrospirota bacterium]